MQQSPSSNPTKDVQWGSSQVTVMATVESVGRGFISVYASFFSSKHSWLIADWGRKVPILFHRSTEQNPKPLWLNYMILSISSGIHLEVLACVWYASYSVLLQVFSSHSSVYLNRPSQKSDSFFFCAPSR